MVVVMTGMMAGGERRRRRRRERRRMVGAEEGRGCVVLSFSCYDTLDWNESEIVESARIQTNNLLGI